MAKPMSEREIAKALGVSRARVRYHLGRALKKLGESADLRMAVAAARDTEHQRAITQNIGSGIRSKQ
jgi:DNA-directed RNA polymerase specialized sigma24 family protein